MNNYLSDQIAKFFEGISLWRGAYNFARLNYMAIRKEDKLLLLSARLFLEIQPATKLQPIFTAGNIQAGQWKIPIEKISIEEVLSALLSSEGLTVKGHGQLVLASEKDRDFSASGPIFLHQQGLNYGNRLAVLSVSGAQRHEYLPQPDTDWLLKAGTVPFDNLNELTGVYGLGNYGDFASLEVVATTAVQVFAGSEVKDKTASMGIWMASSLDKSKAHIGYHVRENGIVTQRGTLSGEQLVLSLIHI